MRGTPMSAQGYCPFQPSGGNLPSRTAKRIPFETHDLSWRQPQGHNGFSVFFNSVGQKPGENRAYAMGFRGPDFEDER